MGETSQPQLDLNLQLEETSQPQQEEHPALEETSQPQLDLNLQLEETSQPQQEEHPALEGTSQPQMPEISRQKENIQVIMNQQLLQTTQQRSRTQPLQIQRRSLPANASTRDAALSTTVGANV